SRVAQDWERLRMKSPDLSTPIVVLSSLGKWFGGFQALKDIDFSVQKGERIVVCGPSGSGKSTLLRCVNGLESFQAGTAVVDGIELRNPQTIRTVRREVGMVFQQFNLFPHLTVLENCILAPMKVRGLARKAALDRAMSLLERVHIA